MDATKWIYVAIGIVVILSVTTALITPLNNALSNVSKTPIYNESTGAIIRLDSSGVPFASLFNSNGIVILMLMAGLLVFVVYSLLKKNK